ncbi:MAG: hypothetical protein IIY06_03115 [Proteobacteria bacterium]|nr:hypothetical protein [Pseudomonadota bacterium]
MNIKGVKYFGLSLMAMLSASSVVMADVPADIVVTPPQEWLVTELGDSQVFSIALASAPASKVILKVESNDPTEGRVDKTELTFLRENWQVPQSVTVTGVDDDLADGNVKFNVNVSLSYTKDNRYKTLLPKTFLFENLDDEEEDKHTNVTSPFAVVTGATQAPVKKTTIRIMSANTTSGEGQSYDPGEGIRIFKAMKPDIVLIQEFNYEKNSIKSFVSSTFGKEYVFHRGKGRIPNGVISRYPITSSGSWKSNKVSDREWEWAVIDIPGERDLLAVSVHLYTQENEAEMGPLRKKIEDKIAKDKKNYYIILGGDFNQPDWRPIQKNFGALLEVGKSFSDWPADQEGMVKTNATRHKQLDYLLCNPDLCSLETPVVVGNRTYPRGHVLDSRVYQKYGEMAQIAPVKPADSAAVDMQHMAVIRDFVVTGE